MMRADSQNKQLKILYLSHRIPYPPVKGDKIRSFHQVRHLAARHHLDLICLADQPGDARHGAMLRQFCRSAHIEQIDPLKARIRGLLSQLQGGTLSVGYFYRKSLQKVVDQWLATTDYDAIICFSSTMAEYVFKSRIFNQAGKKCSRIQLIMDFCDVDSDKWRQYADAAAFPWSSLYRTEFRRMRAYEQKIHHDFDLSILISPHEAELFADSCGSHEHLTVVPNGIDWRFFDPDAVADLLPDSKQATVPSLVFTGAMDYQANVDGVTWFCNEVLPLVQKSIPAARFRIVGSNPTAAVKRLANRTGVEVTGFVEDIRPYYAMADLCVIPLRIARGMQNKLLEAMAMERAVVSTSSANAGINAQSGEHLLIVDSPGGFATAVIELLNSPEARSSLGKAARRFAVDNFDWERNLSHLTSLLWGQNWLNESTSEWSPSAGTDSPHRIDSLLGEKRKSVEVL